VGFGKLGYRVFAILRKLGEAVVVIERDPACQFLEEARRDGSPLLLGDGRREALLKEANIAKARCLILATDDDLANLEMALDAQTISPRIRIVMRMFDQNMADKVSKGFNITMAASPAALSAPTFATSVLAPSVVSSFIMGNQLVVNQQWLVRAGGPLAGRTVGQVIAELRLGVVEHARPGAPGTAAKPMLLPPPDTKLEPGDGVVLQGTLDVLSDLWQRNVAAVAAA
jgi:Trk K+ transport system NAD-binding subunit